MTSTPQDQTFNLDAWIDGINLPETTVTVYADARAANRDIELQAELREALAAERATGDGDGLERSLGDGADSDRITALIDENYQAMKASALTFRVRALPQTRVDDLLTAHRSPLGILQDSFIAASLAEQIVSPTVTVEQAERLRARLPAGEFKKLSDAASNLTHQIGRAHV